MSSDLTNWQKQKFKALFELFDNDGDGLTDETELDGAMDRLQLDTGWSENSRVLSHVSARWRVFLRSLFADSPILSEQKWLDMLARFLRKDRELRQDSPDYRGALEEVAQLLFLLLDRDRSKRIDYQDFLVFFYSLGRKDQHAEDSFDKLDSAEEGFLSKTRLEEVTREYFHGAEPGLAGDWLFGPPPQA